MACGTHGHKVPFRIEFLYLAVIDRTEQLMCLDVAISERAIAP